jgi:hypothetical protein
VEGSPALLIWETHEDTLSADIRDRMLRVTAHPPPELVRNEVLLALQGLLQGLGKTLLDVNLQNTSRKWMLSVFTGAEILPISVCSRMDSHPNR